MEAITSTTDSMNTVPTLHPSSSGFNIDDIAEKVTTSTATYYRLPVDPDDADSEMLYVEAKQLQMIIRFLAAGEPIALLGEAGSGKTELSRAIGRHFMKHLGVEALYQQEFAAVFHADILDGYMQLRNGSTEHIPSEHLKAIRAAADGKKVFYILDEVNRATPQGLNAMLRLYQQWDYIASTQEHYTVDPNNLISVATLNIGHGFSGAHVMDDAFLDRWSPIELAAPPAQILARILADRFSEDVLSAKEQKNLVNLYEKSRKGDRRDYKLGVRDVLRIAKGIAIGGHDLFTSLDIFIGGAVRLRNMPAEQSESLITLARSMSSN